MDEGQIRRFQPLMISGGSITQKVSGTNMVLQGANADILTLGDSTHEGGDIKIYRNATGDLALSFDADAASNAKALDIYGGVVVQNYLTVGQATLNTTYALLANGPVEVVGHVRCYGTKTPNNIVNFTHNLLVTSGSALHSLSLQIHSEDFIVAQATGNGSGGIVSKTIGLYGTTPTTQAAHIADPAENTAANNAAIDAILVALENIGIVASA